MSTVPVLETPATVEPSAAPLTPEDLLSMPDGHRYELLDGKLVERNMGAESSQVALKLMTLTSQFVFAQQLGKTFGADCGYQIFADRPNRVLYPDGSFIARGRSPDERTPRGHVRIAPDLAIEVVSPNDMAEEIEGKRLEYLRAGVKLLWVVYPENQSVHSYRQTGSPAMLGSNDELSGEDVLPNFRCRVAELFQNL